MCVRLSGSPRNEARPWAGTHLNGAGRRVDVDRCDVRHRAEVGAGVRGDLRRLRAWVAALSRCVCFGV
eukprot:scaffold123725_cov63-Phaeocystis_antarctica.AAC.4